MNYCDPLCGALRHTASQSPAHSETTCDGIPRTTRALASYVLFFCWAGQMCYELLYFDIHTRGKRNKNRGLRKSKKKTFPILTNVLPYPISQTPPGGFGDDEKECGKILNVQNKNYAYETRIYQKNKTYAETRCEQFVKTFAKKTRVLTNIYLKPHHIFSLKASES